MRPGLPKRWPDKRCNTIRLCYIASRRSWSRRKYALPDTHAKTRDSTFLHYIKSRGGTLTEAGIYAPIAPFCVNSGSTNHKIVIVGLLWFQLRFAAWIFVLYGRLILSYIAYGKRV